jgi:hypothetical protein
MKTALILPTAFVTTFNSGANSETRIQQYIQGFKQIAEVSSKYSDLDVYLVDNTVDDPSRVDGRLTEALQAIPGLKDILYFSDNEYGKVNKGAGLICAWRGFLARTKINYDFVISFEPRQELLNYDLFDRFVAHPNSYFRLMRPKVKKFRVFPIMLHQVLTGFSIFRKEDMEKYCKEADLETMVRDRISIEDDLFDFLFRNQVSFEVVSFAGIRWHDAAQNTHWEF